MFIVEIQKGVWLASSQGDPGRTLVKENARKYKTHRGAKIALAIAIKKYPRNGWKRASIEQARET